MITMAAGTGTRSLERLTQDVFDVVQRLSLVSARGRRRPGELKEGEFLALAMLEERQTLTVGEIQRELGVLPAQMSRIIRALESRPQPLIDCHINPFDKRKVDVRLSAEGQRVLAVHREQRIGRILEILRSLDEDERENLAAAIERVRAVLGRGES
jgi:DNA-binding MarR family transcriptional regulator